ncbi:small multi-drug export protein [Methanoculleus chikugoensis]|uniref:small multi-drug export protein n=1 Tax=Methanoculleus chikugoensis TaxID=118126 RepID=UPI001FB271C6|nr:small multi-drug export protein [Methanoculleus chikugoensis]
MSPPAGKETIIPLAILAGYPPWWLITAVIFLLDVAVSLFVVWNFDLALKIPLIGRLLESGMTIGRNYTESQPWLRKFSTIGLILFVFFPLQGGTGGAMNGSILGRLLGLEKGRVFACVCTGSLTSCLAFALGSDMLLDVYQQNPPRSGSASWPRSSSPFWPASWDGGCIKSGSGGAGHPGDGIANNESSFTDLKFSTILFSVPSGFDEFSIISVDRCRSGGPGRRRHRFCCAEPADAAACLRGRGGCRDAPHPPAVRHHGGARGPGQPPGACRVRTRKDQSLRRRRSRNPREPLRHRPVDRRLHGQRRRRHDSRRRTGGVPRYQGAEIGGQAHIRHILATKRPIMSEVITVAENIPATVIVAPIFTNEGLFAGFASVVFRPEALVAGIAEPAANGTPPYQVMVIQTDGRVIYDTDPAQIGG